jgi:hypothetical protein
MFTRRRASKVSAKRSKRQNGHENLEKQQPRLLLEAWQRFEKEEIGDDRNLTVQELAEKFLARQKAQGRSTRTIIDDRSRLNAMTKVLGQIRAGAIKRADILRYVEGIAPGTNRRSHYKTLGKLWRWAHDLGHVKDDPMAKLKPLDEWGVNNEVLSPKLFQRFLRVIQGLDGPREGLEPTMQFKGLLSFFVLGGLQGLRTCEMIRERAKDPVIEWRDFLWQKKLMVVRDEVAKQTRSRDRLRYVPLEPVTIQLLKPLATAGAVIPVADSTFYRMRQNLCKGMRVGWPENCLRNSYATYAPNISEFWRRSEGDGRFRVNSQTVLWKDVGTWSWEGMVQSTSKACLALESPRHDHLAHD